MAMPAAAGRLFPSFFLDIALEEDILSSSEIFLRKWAKKCNKILLLASNIAK